MFAKTYLDRKMRFPAILMMAFSIICGLVALDFFRIEGDYKFILVSAFFLTGALIFYTDDRYYRFGWDKDRMYWRGWPKGLNWPPEFSLAFDEVTYMEPGFIIDVARKRRFIPFEFLAISNSHNPEAPELIFFPHAFRHNEQIIEFLEFFRSKRPELFTEEIVEAMERGVW